ncbi:MULTISPECIES: Imm1 family immunity protein [Frankia]|uniref:Uncharacterized protein n=1 Tax=Frankia alni (strain DSM 45986 / CECT 9034 / ACN14a) TaxID=326424 RepID=Q0RT11_FRAAA|nr:MULTISPECIES: Imm1 family immunity protein [Frankia]CAJ59292.1 hypothetical protein FRAAL0618 [Frankia alni ACN14a]
MKSDNDLIRPFTSNSQIWWSRGEPRDEVDYWLGSQPSYCPPWALIPMATAQQVVRANFTTGERPDTVEWAQP